MVQICDKNSDIQTLGQCLLQICGYVTFKIANTSMEVRVVRRVTIACKGVLRIGITPPPICATVGSLVEVIVNLKGVCLAGPGGCLIDLVTLFVVCLGWAYQLNESLGDIVTQI